MKANKVLDDLFSLIRERRTVRAFKTEEIPDEYIEKILEIARWAPSAANSQPWEFIIVRDKNTRERIVEVYEEHLIPKCKIEETRDGGLKFAFPTTGAGFRDAPVFIIVLGDPRLNEAFPLKALKERGDAHFYSSLANAVLLIHLAASTLGLGSQYVSDASSPFMEAMIKNLLGVPEPYEIYELIPIGYPKVVPPPPFRRDLSEIIHREKFEDKKYRNDETIMRFIREKLRRGGTKKDD